MTETPIKSSVLKKAASKMAASKMVWAALAIGFVVGLYLVLPASALPSSDCDQMFINCINAGHSASFCEVQRTACLGGSGGGSGGGPAGPSCGQIYSACIDAGYPQATCDRALDDCLLGP